MTSLLGVELVALSSISDISFSFNLLSSLINIVVLEP